MNTSPEARSAQNPSASSADKAPLPCRFLRCKEMFHFSADAAAFSSGQFS
jgi:hypothetical protein